jgi:hypothetical protein
VCTVRTHRILPLAAKLIATKLIFLTILELFSLKKSVPLRMSFIILYCRCKNRRFENAFSSTTIFVSFSKQLGAARGLCAGPRVQDLGLCGRRRARRHQAAHTGLGPAPRPAPRLRVPRLLPPRLRGCRSRAPARAAPLLRGRRTPARAAPQLSSSSGACARHAKERWPPAPETPTGD